MVGLPDSSVRESRDRVRSAIRNSEFEFPARRITINLAPADVRKRGTSYDWPIAVGLLAASGQLSCRDYADVLFLGELSLDGSIQSTRGVLPMALVARRHAMRLFAPQQAGPEVALVPGLSTALVASLREVVELLEGHSVARTAGPGPRTPKARVAADGPDLSEVRGQQLGRRALEVAAAGRHNLLLVGPPGGGKTMMARRLPGILPPLDFEEAIETMALFTQCSASRLGATDCQTRVRFEHPITRFLMRRSSAVGESQAWRGEPAPQRSALSRRDSRIRPTFPGGLAAAARGGRRAGCARVWGRGISSPVPARSGHEPMSVRIRR